jgi:single-stranded DNA-specific DHH superfamily exonuclease
VRAGRRITVYGDYDADGVTASAILLLCLKHLGAKADCYIPNRIDEGYGLNHDALRTIASPPTAWSPSCESSVTEKNRPRTPLHADHHDHHLPHAAVARPEPQRWAWQ